MNQCKLDSKLLELIEYNSMEITTRIEQLTEKKLIGIRLTMSLAHNKTGELWGTLWTRIV